MELEKKNHSNREKIHNERGRTEGFKGNPTRRKYREDCSKELTIYFKETDWEVKFQNIRNEQCRNRFCEV